MVDWLFKALCSLTARSWFTLSITLFTISGAACCRVSWPEVTWFISCGVQWLVTIITTRGTSSSATEVSSVELWWMLIKWSPRTWCEQEEQGRVDDEEQGVNHVKDSVLVECVWTMASSCHGRWSLLWLRQYRGNPHNILCHHLYSGPAISATMFLCHSFRTSLKVI